MDDSEILPIGREVMRFEAEAVAEAAERLDGEFARAVALIADAPSKRVLCGVGKSGHIARKLAATFSSCGLPAIFLHAAEAMHGDLGVFQEGDPVIVFSKSGTTAEVVRLLPTFALMKAPIIAIVGNRESPIARAATVFIDASVVREADPLGLMPTASSTVMLALGDALASAAAQRNGFTREAFAAFHPGGQLGRNLRLRVGEVLQPLERIAVLGMTATIREVVIAMTRAPYGAACFVDGVSTGGAPRLAGILTDGDIRRILAESGSVLDEGAARWMTRGPICITPDRPLGDAICLMEERSSQISVLPVVDDVRRGGLLGLIRLHDAYQSGALG